MTAVVRPIIYTQNFDVRAYGALGNGVHDDTAAINAALVAGAGAIVTGGSGQTYKVTGPLYVKSGTTIDMRGSTVSLIGSAGPLFRNWAADNPNRAVTDAAISSTVSPTTLTSASAAFTSADVGRTVNVAGATTWGDWLTANIVTVSNGTTVILDTPAATTVTGATCPIYARDSNITILGGTWTRDATSSNDHLIKPRFLDGFTVRDCHIQTLHGKYAISIGAMTNFLIDGITLDTYSDGVHVQGPASKGVISNIYGATKDDFVCVMPYELTYCDVVGNLSDIHVTGLFPNMVASNANGFKVLSGAGCTTTRISARGLYGTVRGFPVWIGEDATDHRMQGGSVDDVSIQEMHTRTILGYNPIYLIGTTIGRVTVNRQSQDTTIQAAAVSVPSGMVVKSLLVENVRIFNAPTNTSYIIRVDGTVTDLRVSHLWGPTNFSGTCPLGLLGASAVVTRAVLDDIHGGNASGGSIVEAATSGAVLGSLTLSGVVWPGPAFIGNLNTATDVILLGNQFSVTNDAFLVPSAAGQLVIRAAHGNTFNNTALSITGGSVRVLVPGYPVDVSTSGLAKTAGDMAYNTNGALACGLGPVISEGTHWKGLYNGTAYP